MSDEKNSVYFTYKDENGKLVSIHIPNLFNRVDELEQKLIGMVNSNTSNQDRIIVLEHTLNIIKEKMIKPNSDSIEELRKSLDAWIDGSRITNKQLTGLKEQADGRWMQHLLDVNLNTKSYLKLEEVLQELMDLQMLYFSDEDFAIEKYNRQIITLKEKLSGEKEVVYRENTWDYYHKKGLEIVVLINSQSFILPLPPTC